MGGVPLKNYWWVRKNRKMEERTFVSEELAVDRSEAVDKTSYARGNEGGLRTRQTSLREKYWSVLSKCT